MLGLARLPGLHIQRHALCLQMRHDEYGHQLWKAEEMATFVAERTGRKIDNIERPSFFRSAFFPPTALAVRLVTRFSIDLVLVLAQHWGCGRAKSVLTSRCWRILQAQAMPCGSTPPSHASVCCCGHHAPL